MKVSHALPQRPALDLDQLEIVVRRTMDMRNLIRENRRLRRKLAALEGGEEALLFASGMCAITTALLTLLSSGDHLVLVSGVYRRTHEFAHSFLPGFI